MKGVLVVVVMHPPTFPSTEGSQITVAVFGRAGTCLAAHCPILGLCAIRAARSVSDEFSGDRKESLRTIGQWPSSRKSLALRFHPQSLRSVMR
jgi:hypothetical protein